MFEKVYMEKAWQKESDLDLIHLASNPIKKIKTYGSQMDAEPFTCSSTGSGSDNEWGASFIWKLGQFKDWMIREVQILNSMDDYGS